MDGNKITHFVTSYEVILKENQELKEKINELEYDYNDLQKDYDVIEEEGIDLLKESQKLKQDLDRLQKFEEEVKKELRKELGDNQRLVAYTLEENAKLKKALAILVEELEISVIEDKQKYDFVYYWLALNGIAEKELNKEKYELFKEVLKNE